MTRICFRERGWFRVGCLCLALACGAGPAESADLDCPDQVAVSHRLGPRPAGLVLGVVPADGRAARWDGLHSVAGVPYWPLEEASSAFGARLWWDPEKLRGEWEVDSLRCRFVVGGEILHCGDRAWQLRAPILYADNRLLVPLDFVAVVIDSMLPGRYDYDERGALLLQRPVLPAIQLPTIEQVGRRTYLRWRLDQAPRTRLVGDGVGAMVVEIDSVGIDPLSESAVLSRSGACLYEVRPDEAGVAFHIAVSTDIRAWRFQWRRERRELELTLSENEGDRAYRTYTAWDPSGILTGPAPGGARDRPVMIVFPGRDQIEAERQRAPEEALCLAQACGQRLVEMLQRAGREVLAYEESDEAEWAGVANRRNASACIILRAHQVGPGVPHGIRLVTYDTRPGFLPMRPLDAIGVGGQGAGPAPVVQGSEDVKLVPWSHVAVRHARGNQELAAALGSGLSQGFPQHPVRSERWVHRSLEGLDLPGVVVYLGDLTGFADPALDRDALPAHVAEMIALGLESFLWEQDQGGWPR